MNTQLDRAKDYVRDVLVNIFHQETTDAEIDRIAAEVVAALPRLKKPKERAA